MELGGLDLESTKTQALSAKEAETLAEQGGDVVLQLHLPGGHVDEHKVAVGVTVAYVKACVANAHAELPAGKIVLKYQGRTLIDPLSLSDCGIAAGSNVALEASLP